MCDLTFPREINLPLNFYLPLEIPEEVLLLWNSYTNIPQIKYRKVPNNTPRSELIRRSNVAHPCPYEEALNNLRMIFEKEVVSREYLHSFSYGFIQLFK